MFLVNIILSKIRQEKDFLDLNDPANAKIVALPKARRYVTSTWQARTRTNQITSNIVDRTQEGKIENEFTREMQKSFE